ncbi:DUF7523 family protein [Halanaeroarchaeum sulfurireducens]|uniref:ACT domain-containing protein n=1 Tax=Halanaeroarchaeum sulfurireducens TaxID=1604004 RepID=A0A0N9MJ19_9EURY|nr:hypothetical protein [Halanaeroarchaeum sulfurireducens]ALG82179.1 hypothetical protein HLASA_1286 [Halanaeroarchaeum sulfurireducens]
MSSLAAATREAVDAHPFVRDGLRAGIVNYSAAARFLDVEGNTEAVATALRRYADELPQIASRDGEVRVTMQSGIGRSEGSFLAVAGTSYGECSGPLTAILATGDVDGRFLATVANRLAGAEISLEALGLADESVVVIVDRRDASTALATVEDAATGYS